MKMEEGSSASEFSQARLEKVEAALGIIFPDGYLSVLRASNGGVPAKKYLRFEGGELVVERFLSLVDNYRDSVHGKYDIDVVWSQIEDRLGEGLVPIAALFAGDFLCLDFRSGGQPAVTLWDHELSREDAPSTKVVAANFSSFLELLHS